MKEFDIEKLKRENIFKTPDGFFDEIQKKVIQEVVPVTKGRIIKLNWAYGAAAAVALLVGVSIFINSDSNTDSPLMNQIDSRSVVSSNYVLSESTPQKEETVALEILEKDLTSVAQVYQKAKIEPSVVAKKGNTSFANQKKRKAVQNPEVQVDQILSSFTSAELADVGKNTEQDIYLDLYN